MASKIKVDQIEGSTASTITLPSGQTLDLSSGSITLPDSAVDLSSAKVTGTLGSSSLPTIPVSKGGTGLTSLGSANQVLAVNSGATALEFQTASGGHLLSFHYDSDNSNHTTNSNVFGTHGSNISISLTPASTSSKFFLLLTFQAGNDTSSRRAYYKFFRDGSELGGSEANLEITGAYSNELPASMSFYDSPNTTSQITYDMRFHCNVNSGDTAKVNYQRFSIFEFAS